MINITLPDGSQRRVRSRWSRCRTSLPRSARASRRPPSPARSTASSSTRVSRTERDAQLAIVTEKSPEALDILRHSTAHLLAQATQRLFPDTQVPTIGPVDRQRLLLRLQRARRRSHARRPCDASRRDAEDRRRGAAGSSAASWRRTTRSPSSKDKGEIYKAQIIDDIIPPGEEISLYGQRRLDRPLPRPARAEHVQAARIQAHEGRGCVLARRFEQRDAPAHLWHGLAQRQGSQGLSDAARGGRQTRSPQDRQGTRPVPSAGRRPGSRVLASEGLVDLAGRRAAYAPRLRRARATREVRCPQVLDVSLWQASGHWDNYKENMFFTESEKRTYALKPMNCPGHVQVFNHGLHSYRDLPIRYGEFGAFAIATSRPARCTTASCACAASPRTTATSSAPRTRSSPSRRRSIARRCRSTPSSGFTDVQLKIALRPDPAPWRRCDLGQGGERVAFEALRAAGVEWQELPGEGAFLRTEDRVPPARPRSAAPGSSARCRSTS